MCNLNTRSKKFIHLLHFINQIDSILKNLCKKNFIQNGHNFSTENLSDKKRNHRKQNRKTNSKTRNDNRRQTLRTSQLGKCEKSHRENENTQTTSKKLKLKKNTNLDLARPALLHPSTSHRQPDTCPPVGPPPVVVGIVDTCVASVAWRVCGRAPRSQLTEGLRAPAEGQGAGRRGRGLWGSGAQPRAPVLDECSRCSSRGCVIRKYRVDRMMCGHVRFRW